TRGRGDGRGGAAGGPSAVGRLRRYAAAVADAPTQTGAVTEPTGTGRHRRPVPFSDAGSPSEYGQIRSFIVIQGRNAWCQGAGASALPGAPPSGPAQRTAGLMCLVDAVTHAAIDTFRGSPAPPACAQVAVAQPWSSSSTTACQSSRGNCCTDSWTRF